MLFKSWKNGQPGAGQSDQRGKNNPTFLKSIDRDAANMSPYELAQHLAKIVTKPHTPEIANEKRIVLELLVKKEGGHTYFPNEEFDSKKLPPDTREILPPWESC
ncbi:MAG: hypothetical protein N3G22_02090 [Candidatus Micrarchaeota archaeon]|nr:hypothetical protein [Candidatus Micrarchaeota archaeon]